MDWSQIASLAGTYGASGGALIAVGYLLALNRRKQKALEAIERAASDPQMNPESRLAKIQGILVWAKVDPTV